MAGIFDALSKLGGISNNINSIAAVPSSILNATSVIGNMIPGVGNSSNNGNNSTILGGNGNDLTQRDMMFIQTLTSSIMQGMQEWSRKGFKNFAKDSLGFTAKTLVGSFVEAIPNVSIFRSWTYKAQLPNPAKIGMLASINKTLGMMYIAQRSIGHETNRLIYELAMITDAGLKTNMGRRVRRPSDVITTFDAIIQIPKFILQTLMPGVFGQRNVPFGNGSMNGEATGLLGTLFGSAGSNFNNGSDGIVGSLMKYIVGIGGAGIVGTIPMLTTGLTKIFGDKITTYISSLFGDGGFQNFFYDNITSLFAKFFSSSEFSKILNILPPGMAGSLGELTGNVLKASGYDPFKNLFKKGDTGQKITDTEQKIDTKQKITDTPIKNETSSIISSSKTITDKIADSAKSVLWDNVKSAVNPFNWFGSNNKTDKPAAIVKPKDEIPKLERSDTPEFGSDLSSTRLDWFKSTEPPVLNLTENTKSPIPNATIKPENTTSSILAQNEKQHLETKESTINKNQNVVAKDIGNKLDNNSNVSENDAFGIMKELIKQSEGLSLTPYLDPPGNTKNQYSIGYGHLIKKGEENLLNATLTKEQADQLFDQDFPKYAEGAKTFPGYDKFDPIRKAALIDLSYNRGPSWWKKHSDFVDAMNISDWQNASDSLMSDSTWVSQVKRRAPMISNLIKFGSIDDLKKGYGSVINYVAKAKPYYEQAKTKTVDFASELKNKIVESATTFSDNYLGGGFHKDPIKTTTEQSFNGNYSDEDYDYKNSWTKFSKTNNKPIENSTLNKPIENSTSTIYNNIPNIDINNEKPLEANLLTNTQIKPLKKELPDGYIQDPVLSDLMIDTKTGIKYLKPELAQEARDKRDSIVGDGIVKYSSIEDPVKIDKNSIIDSELTDEQYKAMFGHDDLLEALSSRDNENQKRQEKHNTNLIQNIMTSTKHMATSVGNSISKAIKGLEQNNESMDELDKILTENPKISQLLLGYE